MPKFKVTFTSRHKTEKHTAIVEAPGIIEAYTVAVKRLSEPELKEMDLTVLPYNEESSNVENFSFERL